MLIRLKMNSLNSDFRHLIFGKLETLRLSKYSGSVLREGAVQLYLIALEIVVFKKSETLEFIFWNLESRIRSIYFYFRSRESTVWILDFALENFWSLKKVCQLENELLKFFYYESKNFYQICSYIRWQFLQLHSYHKKLIN